jgi:hypothetical protein
MKKKSFSFLALCCFVCFFACKKMEMPATPKTGTVELILVPTYQGQTFVASKTYKYKDNLPIQFVGFTFFLSNLNILDAVNKATPSTVSLFHPDFGQPRYYNEATAKGGDTLKLGNFAVGDYSKITFGIGVPAELNKKTPKDFKDPELLSDYSAYWDSWKSYIFSRIEGAADGNGDGLFEDSFTYHTGFDKMYRNITLDKTVSVKENAVTRITVEIDLYKILSTSAKTVDVLTETQSHGPNEAALATFLMDNYQAAVK